MPYQQATIQPFLHLHSDSGVAGAIQSGIELQGATVVSHRVVLAYSTQLLDTQHATQVEFGVQEPVG